MHHHTQSEFTDGGQTLCPDCRGARYIVVTVGPAADGMTCGTCGGDGLVRPSWLRGAQ